MWKGGRVERWEKWEAVEVGVEGWGGWGGVKVTTLPLWCYGGRGGSESDALVTSLVYMMEKMSGCYPGVTLRDQVPGKLPRTPES